MQNEHISEKPINDYTIPVKISDASDFFKIRRLIKDYYREVWESFTTTSLLTRTEGGSKVFPEQKKFSYSVGILIRVGPPLEGVNVKINIGSERVSINLIDSGVVRTFSYHAENPPPPRLLDVFEWVDNSLVLLGVRGAAG